MTQTPGPVSPTSYRCIKCGYDLSGSPVGGRCPECGTPVGHSLTTFQTAATAPGATMCLVFGIIGISVCGWVGPVAIILHSRAKREIQSGQYSSSSAGLAKAGFVLGCIGTVFGVLQFAYLAVIIAMAVLG